MATKIEKTIGTTLGLLIGGYLAHNWAKNQEDIKDENILWYALGGAFLGGFSGYGLACLLGSANDTVNYQLYNGNKRVYHGITFEDRAHIRKAEHIKVGKQFTKMKIDKPKPRVEALELEKILIQKDKPLYNIQHNVN